MRKRIHIIINPAAGKAEPILSLLNAGFMDTPIDWDVSITHHEGDAVMLAEKARHGGADIVAAYGGDGTVIEVARSLGKTETPLAIIPGGTANVLTKELGIPTDTSAAIKLLTANDSTTKIIDMGSCGDRQFVLRINIGSLAEIVKQAPRELKDSLGQMAYAVSAAGQVLQPADIVTYTLELDGKRRVVEGVALVIANAGSIGVGDLSMSSNIDVADGALDVLVFKQNDIQSLISWATSAVMGRKPHEIIHHWKAKQVKVEVSKPQAIICDDHEVELNQIETEIIPAALKVIVPKQDSVPMYEAPPV